VCLAAALAASGCAQLLGQGRDTSGPGERARDYLRAQPYTSVLVELDYVDGSAPEDRAVSLLQSRLNQATGKAIEVVKTGGVAGMGAGHRYTLGEVVDLEGKFRGQSTGGTQAVLYVLYVDGGFERDTNEAKTLAAAYRGSSVVLFKGSIREASCTSNCLNLPVGNTKPPIAEVEESVVVHEAGHILGLVNNGIPMQSPHEDTDPDHGRHHSSDQGSVMYWAVETSVVGSILGQTPPDDFDANDKADLQAARA
jgi:hypothetical protein